MEQRSQILKQMHLTKNEREREVSLPPIPGLSRATSCFRMWGLTGVGGSGLTSLATSTTLFTLVTLFAIPS